MRSADNPNRVTNAFSTNLNGLEKPNSILFLDEYNRQVKPQIRASLYTLINEHAIAGDDTPKGTHVFKNLLFTIACINPAVPTDKGAAPLNDAELSRFPLKLEFDSNPLTALDYFKKNYDFMINKLNPKDEFYKDDLEQYLRVQDLGTFICSHKEFTPGFDTKDDLEDLADQQATMFNQRSLTDGLNLAEGDKDKFEKWVDDYSEFLEKDKELLHHILANYVVPSFDDLCKAKGINLDAGKTTVAAEPEKPAEPEAKEAEIEDDGSFFSQPASAGSARTVSPAVAVGNIKGALANWPTF